MMSVPNEAILEGPKVNWNHIDGPLMSWASHIHWLTWKERMYVWLRIRTIDEVACTHWPHLNRIRKHLVRAS